MPRPYATRAAIRLALRRKPPENQNIFDDPPPDTNHYFIYLLDAEGERRFIVREMDDEGVGGPWFESKYGPSEFRKITNRELRRLQPSFLQVYRNRRFTYNSAWSLFWAWTTSYPARAHWWMVSFSADLTGRRWHGSTE